ncbi:hypothetical protein INR49_023068 [Caranx melampygus]|nr:hypothetical protein INR49_023068 [Caranx melampygus]
MKSSSFSAVQQQGYSASIFLHPSPSALCHASLFIKQIKEEDTEEEEGGVEEGCWGSELQLCIGHLNKRGWSFSISPTASTVKQRVSTHSSHKHRQNLVRTRVGQERRGTTYRPGH